MKYAEMKKQFETIDPETLAPKGAKGDQIFRYHVLSLMFEIFGALDSVAFSYHEMLKIQQRREGPGPVADRREAAARQRRDQQQADRGLGV